MFEHRIFGPDVFEKLDDDQHKILQLLEGEINLFISNYSRNSPDTYLKLGFLDVPLNSELLYKLNISARRLLVRTARAGGWLTVDLFKRKIVPYLRLGEIPMT